MLTVVQSNVSSMCILVWKIPKITEKGTFLMSIIFPTYVKKKKIEPYVYVLVEHFSKGSHENFSSVYFQEVRLEI